MLTYGGPVVLEISKKVNILPDHYKWLGNNFKLSKEVGVTAEDLQAAIPGMELHEVPRNTIIIKENEPGDDLFVLQFGKAVVSKVRQHFAPKDVVTLVSGDYFGEIGLLGGGTRKATVQTLEDCRVFKLPAAQVQDLL